MRLLLFDQNLASNVYTFKPSVHIVTLIPIKSSIKKCENFIISKIYVYKQPKKQKPVQREHIPFSTDFAQYLYRNVQLWAVSKSVMVNSTPSLATRCGKWVSASFCISNED